MANVSVFNLEGNEVGTLELNDAVFGVEVNEHLVQLRKQKPVPKFPAVVRNRGDRKVPDMQDRVQQELRSGRAAA